MSQDDLSRVLGSCPVCQQRLVVDTLLATYTVADGWPRMLAECPDCDEILTPV